MQVEYLDRDANQMHADWRAAEDEAIFDLALEYQRLETAMRTTDHLKTLAEHKEVA